MYAQQIVLPFLINSKKRLTDSNVDLIGRWYEDDRGKLTVIGIPDQKAGYVTLRRTHSGQMFTVPAWLIRMIFIENKGQRAA